MKPLKELTLETVKNIKLLSFDADGVTVERGTEVLEKQGTLTIKSKIITDELLEKIRRLKKRFRINVTSGRNLVYLNQMLSPLLWEDTSLQGENGLFTLVDGEVIQITKITPGELKKIEKVRTEISQLARRNDNIKGFEPKQFMISVHCSKEDQQIVDIVRRIDTNGEMYCYWVSNEAYDIFFKRFNKGVGLEFLVKYLGIDLDQTLAVGNDINDKPMLNKAGISITTNKESVEADYYTEKALNLGGVEVVDKLLTLYG